MSTFTISTISNTTITNRNDFNSCVHSYGQYAVSGSAINLGLWYSSDYGISWTQSNIVTGGYRCIYMDNLGNAMAGSGSPGNTGLWFSRNKGVTWYKSNIKTGAYWTIIMIGSDSYATCSNNFGGIVISSDYGQTWTLLHALSGPSYGLVNYDRYIIVGSTRCLYCSDNFGTTWTQNTGMGTINCIVMSGFNVLAIDTTFSQKGIWYSLNAGITWNAATCSNVDLATVNFRHIAMVGTKAIACCFNNPVGIFYSTNSGQTWTKSLNIGFNSVYMDSAGNAIACSTVNGIYYSRNSGQTWANSNNIIIFDYYN